MSTKEKDLDDHDFMKIAIDEGAQGLAEGGVPVGAALVADGRVLGSGHNRRVQQGSVIRSLDTCFGCRFMCITNKLVVKRLGCLSSP